VVTDPGPTVLGAGDPREASVYLAGLTVEKQCATLTPTTGRLRGC